MHSLAILTVDGGATVAEFLITKDRVDILGCFVEKLLSKGFFLLKKLVAGCVAKAILVAVFWASEEVFFGRRRGLLALLK